MDSPGRFALPSMSALVQRFFSDLNVPVKRDANGEVTFYTKQEAADLFGLTSYRVDINQYQFDDGPGDYASAFFCGTPE